MKFCIYIEYQITTIMEAKTTTQTIRDEAIASPKFQVSMKKSARPPMAKHTESCPICMDVIGTTNCAKTSCGHSFCLSCIVKCLESNHICPLCREDITEKKEATAGKKLKMEDAVRIIEDEMDSFGLHTQLSMARQFGLRALKTVVQSFALSTAHSIALMQNEEEVDGSWDEIDDEEYASEADESEADESEADSDDEACEAADSDDEACEAVDSDDEAEADSDDACEVEAVEAVEAEACANEVEVEACEVEACEVEADANIVDLCESDSDDEVEACANVVDLCANETDANVVDLCEDEV